MIDERYSNVKPSEGGLCPAFTHSVMLILSQIMKDPANDSRNASGLSLTSMLLLALPSDQTNSAKARFSSNATRGQSWALHAKGRISASATYERTGQAFATRIRNLAETRGGSSL